MSMREPPPPLENDSTNERRKSYDHSLTLPRRLSEAVNSNNSRNFANEKSLLEPQQRDSNITTTPSSSRYDLSGGYEPPRTVSKTKINELALPSSFSRRRSPSRDSYSSMIGEKCPTSDTECFTLDNFRRKRAARSASLRGSSLKPDYFLPKPSAYVPYTSSADSSISDALSAGSSSSKNDNYYSCKNNSLSDSKRNLVGSETNRLDGSISPSKYEISDCSDSEKSKQPKRSRFLRPNFFDSRDEEPIPNNPYLREKKEREMETQKVLKEIRDKRKSKMRERSASRERRKTAELTENNSVTQEIQTTDKNSTNLLNRSENILAKSTENLLKNVSDNIKNLETNVRDIHDYVNLRPFQLNAENDQSDKEPIGNVIHDYVNLKANEMPEEEDNFTKIYQQNGIQKKERISKIARPKSYPTESVSSRYVTKIPTISEKDENKSKICKLKRPDNYDKIKMNQYAPSSSTCNKTETIYNNKNSHKKEKLPEEDKIDGKELKKKLNLTGGERSTKNKLLQSIEKRLEKLRSFNNSPTVAITAEENNENKEEEKKSNVETAIKRLREQSVPVEAEPCITESGLIKRAVSVEDFPSLGSKQLQTSKKSVTKILNLFKKYEEKDKKNEKQKMKKSKDDEKTDSNNKDKEHLGANNSVISECKSQYENVNVSQEEKHEKCERPRSLLIEKMKHFQNPYSGAKSDSLLLGNDKSCGNNKSSRLPVNSFRRSLNLENISKNYNKSEEREENPPDAIPTVSMSRSPQENINGISNTDEESKFNRKNLHLDLSTVPSINVEPNQNPQEERNSFVTGDNSSLFLSPGEDVNDTWSVCSDYHTHELTSPVSPTGQFYSADEGESVIDRIRRKSFYTRFNEKKRPRKTNVSNYRDLDYYKNIGYSNPGYRSPSGKKSEQKVSYPLPEPSTKDNSLSVHNYVNLPRYNTYHPRSSQLAAMDTIPTVGRSKTSTYGLQSPSKFNTRSLIPNIDRFSNTESPANNNLSSNSSVQSSANPV